MHSPCPQTVHAERGKWPVDKNSAMLRSALGELSPCANGTENRVINSAKGCKKRLEKNYETPVRIQGYILLFYSY